MSNLKVFGGFRPRSVIVRARCQGSEILVSREFAWYWKSKKQIGKHPAALQVEVHVDM
jgi:hypothetical protein